MTFIYRGHPVTVIPDHDRDEGVWLARVAIDVRTPDGSERVYYTDHLNKYTAWEDAVAAGRDFGRHIIDTFIVPSVGEQDGDDTGQPA